MKTSRLALLIGVVLSVLCVSVRAQQLTVASRLPDNNAKLVNPDTLLSITFNRPPTLGTTGQVRIYDAADNKLVDTLDLAVPINQQNYTIGTVQFHAYPVMISGNTATIHPHNNLLVYGKTYYVQIDPGVLTDGEKPFAGYAGNNAWTFFTKPAPPANLEKLVVAPDGSGDFATLQGAIDAVPANNTQRITIQLRKGVYTEIISIVDKANITIVGEDRKQTILTYPNNEKVQFGQGSSNRRGVVDGLRSTGIVLANMTIRNATPKGTGGGWQAEAVIFKSNSQVILTDLDLYSFQDTLQMSSPGYVTNCHIEGDVDFMWGTGPCFFRDCDFVMLNNNCIFTVSRNTARNHGFVYLNCKFGVAPGVTGAILANNQGYGDSEVVLLNCPIAPQINPTAWRGSGPNVRYWEYNSTNIENGQPADVSARAAGSKQLSKEADAETIANFSNPTFVLGGWTPTIPPMTYARPNP